MKKIDPKLYSLANFKRSRYPPFRKHSERAVLGVLPSADWSDNKERYTFAVKEGLVDRKNVLDLCCGIGYGSEILAKRASKVTGVDVSPKAIEFAKENYKRKNLEFKKMDAGGLEMKNDSVDVICAFEALEHVTNPDGMLSEMKRVLKKGGTAIISTPNRYFASPFVKKPFNPHHVKEYLPDEFLGALGKHFKVEGLYGQMIFSSKQAYRHARLKRLLSYSGILGPLARFRNLLTGRKSAKQGGNLQDAAVKKLKINGSHQPTYMVAVCRKE
ncbi:MAG: class I SAM-dependent methyltransferase [Candidatus Diapherotrites archaeon]